MANNKSNFGFTLIELSIVLVISSLLLVGALQAYKIYDEKQKMERATALMADIDQAILNFVQEEGRFPCPAPVNGSAAGNNYDLEQCNTVNGVKRVNAGSGNILIGKLPAETLEISNSYMKDAYGNYLVYAITEAATIDESVTGAIRVIEEGVDEDGGSTTYGQLVPLQIHNNVLYSVVSLGSSYVGAYQHDGSQQIACSGTQKEVENCDDDGVFISSLFSERNDVDDFYDDKISFKTKLNGLVSNIPDALFSAKRGVDFKEVSPKRYEILTDDVYASWEWTCDTSSDINCGITSQSSGSYFLELKKGDEVNANVGRGNNIRITDNDGNSIALDNRQIDKEFIFATNPSSSKDNGFSVNRYIGGNEMTGGSYSQIFYMYK